MQESITNNKKHIELTKKTYLSFIKLLDKFDPRYYNSDKLKYYLANKERNKRIEELTINIDFLNIYKIWLSCYMRDISEQQKESTLNEIYLALI